MSILQSSSSSHAETQQGSVINHPPLHDPLKSQDSFAALQLNPALVQALEAAGYTQPTPVQKQAIPLALS